MTKSEIEQILRRLTNLEFEVTLLKSKQEEPVWMSPYRSPTIQGYDCTCDKPGQIKCLAGVCGGSEEGP